ncbi:039R [Invertebrate iridescent virus Kaz2018]|uniref:Uncharacterized protein n=1 Tax=Iridovirus sp. TaxID=135728 RepID=A0AAU7YEJ5_9VIRU|nr:039R [Invertebrate iridescent virus Kaz2018]
MQNLKEQHFFLILALDQKLRHLYIFLFHLLYMFLYPLPFYGRNNTYKLD